MSTAARTWRTRAPFLIRSRWHWIEWTNRHASKHEAIIEKGKSLGAQSWDFGQADHARSDRFM